LKPSVAVATNNGAGLPYPLLVAFGIAAAIGTSIAGPAVDTSAHVAGSRACRAVLALMKLTGEPRLGATITLLAWGATGFGISSILQHQASRAVPRNPEIVCGAGGADRVSAHGASCGGMSRARSRIG
jgi:predicted MFS family arabinose efflux permease